MGLQGPGGLFQIGGPVMSIEAELALEWLRASGERTEARLADLVDHFCDTNAVRDPGTRAAIFAEAKADLEKRS